MSKEEKICPNMKVPMDDEHLLECTHCQWRTNYKRMMMQITLSVGLIFVLFVSLMAFIMSLVS